MLHAHYCYCALIIVDLTDDAARLPGARCGGRPALVAMVCRRRWRLAIKAPTTPVLGTQLIRVDPVAADGFGAGLGNPAHRFEVAEQVEGVLQDGQTPGATNTASGEPCLVIVTRS